MARTRDRERERRGRKRELVGKHDAQKGKERVEKSEKRGGGRGVGEREKGQKRDLEGSGVECVARGECVFGLTTWDKRCV